MPPGLPPDRFGLIPFRSPLLRELLLLSFPVGTEMFQFPTFPRPVLCVHTGVTPHNGRRVSPFGHPRINAFSAAPRGLSQPDTSFIGSRRQGIRRWLFVAWNSKLEERCSCSLCNSQRADRAGEVRHERSHTSSIGKGNSAFPQNGREDGTICHCFRYE